MKKIIDKITYKIIHVDDKVINTITIIVDILTAIIFTLTLILRTNLMYGLYWIAIILFLIVDVVSIVSRNDNESYNDYIDRILKSNNDKAINIKIVDMKHNMDLSRIENPTEKDIERIERKYKPQYKKIINYIKKENEI